MREALDIQVKGIVQGVGFRPFVYRAAQRFLISGWVLNAVDGVFIHAEGEHDHVAGFVAELHENPPAASQVKELDLKEVPLQGFSDFQIRFSDEAHTVETTLVSPDLATCPECAAELFDPVNRRFRYPFINCTNCGPRFTIIDELPYDRAKTSMAAFPMCDPCATEYADPLDRRFHAQPDACFDCGPALSWKRADSDEITWGNTREASDAIVAQAVEMLLYGKIVAVKGLGGFHLVCDANNAAALARLRQRKRREGKAFAVMVDDLASARRLCFVSPEEEKLLRSAACPIVLLRRRPQIEFAPGLVGDLPELGLMLPYTPLQHLLLHDFSCAYRAQVAQSFAREGQTAQEAQAFSAAPTAAAQATQNPARSTMPPMLVMTSGNVHDDPIVTDDAEAYVRLGNIADAFIGNNREIRTRFDDSVVRVLRFGEDECAVQLIRRARGYCPTPLRVKAPRDSACLFAAGSEQKNTFAFARTVPDKDEAEVFVSQHMGDLEYAENFDAWLVGKQRFEQLFKLVPERMACDLHPEYLASKWARQAADRRGHTALAVQHHHAHIASVIGEHGLQEPVCGIAFDGTGYGMDGKVWGGEVLLANAAAFERFANFAYVPLPGGSAAIRDPLRMAYGVLWAFDLLDHPGAAAVLNRMGDQASVCSQMIERGINTPFTSSVGRLFDAASALLGICTIAHYEGEPAILLEAAAHGFCAGDEDADADAEAAADVDTGADVAADAATDVEANVAADEDADADTDADADAAERYAIAIIKNAATANSTAQDTSVLVFDAAPTFTAVLDDMCAGVPRWRIARRFHDAFVDVIVNAALLVQAGFGISTVALSGGVFMNRYLVERSVCALEAKGFTVALNKDLPPNDGCISYGQAVVALHADEERADEGGCVCV